MWKGETIETAIKVTGLKNYIDGYFIVIKKEDVKLNREGYTRREKVY